MRRARASVVQDGTTTLHSAAQEGHAEVVKQLLRSNAIVDARDGVHRRGGGCTALHRAAEFGHAEAVEQLLKGNANVNAET